MKQVSWAGSVSKPVIGADPPDTGIWQSAVPQICTKPGSETELGDLLAKIGVTATGLDLVVIEHIVDIHEKVPVIGLDSETDIGQPVIFRAWCRSAANLNIEFYWDRVVSDPLNFK